MNTTHKRILISVGEASGDMHAANLISDVLKKNADVTFYGMGGSLMQQAGARILVDAKDLAIIGGFEIVTHCFKIAHAFRVMQRALKHDRPDLLILVDYAGFNLRLAKYAKKLGIKVLYYISPKIWAWHQSRVKIIKKNVDVMAVIFPFEVDFYKRFDVSAVFVGNPLLKIVKPTRDIAATKIKYGLDLDAKTIGLLPGSRLGEIKRLLPIMLVTAELLQAQVPKTQFVLPLASSITMSDLTPYLQHTNVKIQIVTDDTYNIVKACDAAIVKSGTATLETTLLGTPFVLIYKKSSLEAFFIRRIIKIPFIGLSNILANKKIVVELLQEEANPEQIAQEVAKILVNDSYREQMLTNFKQVQTLLENNVQTNIAALVLKTIGIEIVTK